MGRDLSDRSKVRRPRQQIGPALRDLRARQGWSLTELAQRSRISRSHLSRLEQGRSVPSYLVLARLAAALGVNINYFTSFERTSHELESELVDYLEALAIPRSTWPEFAGLGLEARGALLDALHRLTAPRANVVPPQHALNVAILSRGVADSVPLIQEGIDTFGLPAADFMRARVQIEEMAGERLVVADRISMIMAPCPVDHLQVFRIVFGSDVPNPMLLKWWIQSMHTAMTTTLRTQDARSIYPLSWIERYLTTCRWGPRLPVAPAVMRCHIQSMIDLLRTYPRFRVGLLDTPPPFGMLIKGTSDTLAFQLPTGDQEPRQGAGFGVRFSGPEFAGRFRTYFESLWDSIPEERREPEAIASWLEFRLATVRQSP